MIRKLETYTEIRKKEYDYEEIKEAMRKKHDIREWMKVKILIDLPGDEGRPKPVSCLVYSIDKYFITLEFPKKYRQSFAWDDFEKMRVNDQRAYVGSR